MNIFINLFIIKLIEREKSDQHGRETAARNRSY